MSKSQITTPILLKNGDKLYKLIYINFSKDGSIYIYFPRKKGYLVTKEVGLPSVIVGKTKVVLDNVESKFENPYISFHPGKKAIHINTQKGEIYKIDTEVINLAEDKKILCFSLCQLIIPTFSYLDIYNSSKHIFPLFINFDSLKLLSSLNLEIWVHPIGHYIDITETPYYEKRSKETKIIGSMIFNNKNLRFYTCTLLISEIKKIVEDGIVPGINVVIQNENRSYIFELAPIF